MIKSNLLIAIKEICSERQLPREKVLGILKEAIKEALLKKSKYKTIEVDINENTGDIQVRYFKIIVEKVEDPLNEISLSDTQEIDKNVELGDEVEYFMEQKQYADIIAQTTRYNFFQKIRDIENENTYQQYEKKINDIVQGTIVKTGKRVTLVQIAKNILASLERKEQIPGEIYQIGDKIQALLIDIKKDNFGINFSLSRTAPEYLAKLFEIEIPEVADGTIEILAIAREPGIRAKVATKTNDSDIDPIGSCVGARGSRIHNIINEINGEKIDVIEWSSNTKQFIADALSPAEVESIEIDEEKFHARVIVDQENFSLAIGKRGKNIRLAESLTQFQIDVQLKESEQEKQQKTPEDDTNVPEVKLFSE